jgi:hypothetical protein
MGSTIPSTPRRHDQEAIAPAVLRWRNWPLAENARWSWLVPLGILAIGGMVAYLGNSLLLGTLALLGLAATMWRFFVPVRYEISPLGLQRSALGRMQRMSWRAVRAYQLRPTGVVLFQHPDPNTIDLLRSAFIPYPVDEDDVLCALREHLSHAVEMPP